MAPTIIDKKQVAANLARATRLDVTGADFLFAHALDQLDERLSVVTRRFDQACVIGPLADRVAGRLSSGGNVARAVTATTNAAEIIDLAPQSVDLIVSLLHLHLIDDVPGALIQMRRALRPDGLLLACVPSAGTLHELRASLIDAESRLTGGAHARVMPFLDVRDAGALLQRAGLALPVADADVLVARYDTMFDLMADLRAMGATNALADRPRRFTPRMVLFDAARVYARDHADADGRIRATFAFVWMSGWAPDDSQPKPLKPGSAAHSLAEALKDRS